MAHHPLFSFPDILPPRLPLPDVPAMASDQSGAQPPLGLRACSSLFCMVLLHDSSLKPGLGSCHLLSEAFLGPT